MLEEFFFCGENPQTLRMFIAQIRALALDLLQ